MSNPSLADRLSESGQSAVHRDQPHGMAPQVHNQKTVLEQKAAAQRGRDAHHCLPRTRELLTGTQAQHPGTSCMLTLTVLGRELFLYRQSASLHTEYP